MNVFSRQIADHVKLCPQCARAVSWAGAGGMCRTGIARQNDALNRGRPRHEVDEAIVLGQTLFMLRKVDP